MRKSDFYYDLPVELIAQHPAEKRDCSRLLYLDRRTGKIQHKHFFDIIDYIDQGDCLILNDTRVLPARLYGEKIDTKSKVEFLLLKQIKTDTWEVLVKPGKKAKIGSKFSFGDGKLIAKIVGIATDGNRTVEFTYSGNFYDVLYQIGIMPLPPYIKETLKDKESYQTVYSKNLGSVAAPTAGLHFTNELLDKLNEKQVNIGFVTLHVGLGTFRPVKTDNIEDHNMHSEHYSLSEDTAKLIKTTHEQGKKVFAVGTTSCRTLEAICSKYGEIQADEGSTNIFIYPGYKFKCIDALITNFHLPESTLIMLVSAFSSRKNILNAYEEAVKEKYRFFSFGDAMLIK